MIELKHFQVQTQKRFRRTLLHLPDELLDEIIKHVYIDGGHSVRDLLQISTTSQRLRKATAPLIFHTLRFRLSHRYVDRRTFNILLNLQSHPETFSSYVRHLKQDDDFCFREEKCEDLNLENELVRQVAIKGLKELCNLRCLSVGCQHSPILSMAMSVLPQHPLLIQAEACACPRSADQTSLSPMERLCSNDVAHQFAVTTSSGRRLAPLEPWLSNFPEKTIALSWQLSKSARLTPSIPGELILTRFSSLQELHLKWANAVDDTLEEISAALLKLSRLRHLSGMGPALCGAILRVVNQLPNLESLRLHSALDRVFHAHLRNHDFEGLPYLRLPRLRSLELRYISRYLSIKHVVPPSVEHLRIEYHNRNERLTSYDLRWIARCAPNLNCLELNCGPLANLWHPTAIAGVDVDMEVYGMLESLSSFSSLRQLRLFPSYWQSSAGYLHFTQPVADEQAVRIYNHLRLRCKRLQVLIISNSHLDYASRNEIFSRGLSEPVKWVVRRWGKFRTLLLTHEAKKTYHLEQVWEGDRRLRMTTVRHSGRRRHFDDFGEWILPGYEFPFDEPGPCGTRIMTDGLSAVAHSAAP